MLNMRNVLRGAAAAAAVLMADVDLSRRAGKGVGQGRHEGIVLRALVDRIDDAGGGLCRSWSPGAMHFGSKAGYGQN